MRILGGRFRGRRLQVPARGTRPSTGRLREALFSMLLPRLPDARVVDLFAGSGSLGLEALSRGAASALFVERDPAALSALRDNVDRLGLEAVCTVRRVDAQRWLAAQIDAPGTPWDIVFADPPYEPELALALLSSGRALVECAGARLFCLEHAAGFEPSDPVGALREQTRRYGQSAFTLVEGAVA